MVNQKTSVRENTEVEWTSAGCIEGTGWKTIHSKHLDSPGPLDPMLNYYLVKLVTTTISNILKRKKVSIVEETPKMTRKLIAQLESVLCVLFYF